MVIKVEKGTNVMDILNFMKKIVDRHRFIYVDDLLEYLDEGGISYQPTPPFPSRDRTDWGWTWTEVYSAEVYSARSFQGLDYASAIRISDPAMRHVEREADNVNHPKHYISKKGIEMIDVIEAFTENLEGIEATDTGNIVKYISRWKKKNGLEDLKKARWYLDHLIAHVEKEDRDEFDTKKHIL